MMNQVQTRSFREKLKAYMNYFIIGLSLLLTLSLVGNIRRTLQSIKTVEKKEAEVLTLEEKNKELKKRLESVSSEAFVEKQIRDQLGLAKAGEIVIVLPDHEVLVGLVPDLPVEEDELPDPNWRKWWNLFFN